jgi:hypothetical protein
MNTVIPAKAGIHGFEHLYISGAYWIPAFAGMTQFILQGLMSMHCPTLRITAITVFNILS